MAEDIAMQGQSIHVTIGPITAALILTALWRVVCRFQNSATGEFNVLRLHHLDIPLLEQCIVDVMFMAEDIAMQAQSIHALYYSPTYFTEAWITDGQISSMLDEAEAM